MEGKWFIIPLIILTLLIMFLVIQGHPASNKKAMIMYQTLNNSTKTLTNEALASKKEEDHDKIPDSDNVYIVIEPDQFRGIDGKLHDAFIDGNIKITKGHEVTLHFYNYDHKFHTYTSLELGINIYIKGATKKGVARETSYTFTPKKQGAFPWSSTAPYDTYLSKLSATNHGFMKGIITVLPTNNKTQYISLVVNHNYKLAKDGNLHDAYTPGDITVVAGRPVKITIYNFTLDPHPFGISMLNYSLNVNKRIALGEPSIWTGTFTITKPGKYQWNCLAPCDDEYHQYAMLYDGYMTGFVTAIKNNGYK